MQVGRGMRLNLEGDVIDKISVEGRMTICNMAIEAGASGLVAFDKKTEKFVVGRPLAPRGKDLELALSYWQTLKSDNFLNFDKIIKISGNNIKPQVTWGITPDMVLSFCFQFQTLKCSKCSNKRLIFESFKIHDHILDT